MSDSEHEFSARLNSALSASGLPSLDPAAGARFAAYYSLLHRWNQRINLTAIRSEEEILNRHFVESIAVAHSLPAGVASLLDFGSGAGFPGLPIAVCCPQIAVVLAESQTKKAAFLREAVRTLDVPVEVFAGRAETLIRTFDCVVLRAVDRMGKAILAASSLVEPGGRLALLTTDSRIEALKSAMTQLPFTWDQPLPLPSSEARVLLFGKRE